MQIERKVTDQLAAPVLLVYKEKIELAASQRKREKNLIHKKDATCESVTSVGRRYAVLYRECLLYANG